MAQFTSTALPGYNSQGNDAAGRSFVDNNPGWRWSGGTPKPTTPAPAPYQNPDEIHIFNRYAADVAVGRGRDAATRYAAEQAANASKQGSYQQGLTGIGNNLSGNYNTYGGILGQGMQGATGAYGTKAQNDAQNLRTYQTSINNAADNEAAVMASQAGASTGLANANASMFSNNAQSRAGIAQAYAQAAAQNQIANANIAGSAANERGNLANADATSAAANSVARGNMASAALGAFGGMGNSALTAASQNNGSYQQALAILAAANQGGLANNAVGQANAYANQGSSNQAALSGLGQSQNAALGNMSAAYGGLGQAGISAGSKNAIAQQLLGSFGGGNSFGSGGGSFDASGPGGQIASGSYTGSGGGGGSMFGRTSGQGYDGSGANQAYGGLAGLRGEITNPSVLQGLQYSNADAMDRIGNASGAGALQAGYNSAAGDMRSAFLSGQSQPQTMLNSAYPQLQSLFTQGLDSLGPNTNFSAGGTDFSPYMKALSEGFATGNTNIGNESSAMTSAYNQAMAANAALRASNSDMRASPLNPLATSSYQDAVGRNASDYQGVLANLTGLVGSGQTGYDTANQGARDVMGNMGTAYYSQPPLTSGRQEFQYNNYRR